MKIVTGKKIKGSEYEKFLIELIIADPEVSNYSLSKKVYNEYRQKVSSPTVKAWRDNYFPKDESVLEEIKKRVLGQQNDRIEYNRNLTAKVTGTIDFYLKTAASLEQKVQKLMKKQELSERESGKKEDYEIDMAVEKLIIDYLKLIDTYRSRAFRFTGGVEYVQRLQELIRDVSVAAINVFYPYLNEDKKKKCKSDFDDAILKIQESVYQKLPESKYESNG